MFEMTKIMGPVAIVQVIFWGTIGYTLLEKVLKPGSPDFDKNNAFANPELLSTEDKEKCTGMEGNRIISCHGGMYQFCLLQVDIKPFKSYFNIANIAMLGSVGSFPDMAGAPVKKAPVIFRGYPDLYRRCKATGTGLDMPGGGAVIADTVLNMFGGANASVSCLKLLLSVYFPAFPLCSCRTVPLAAA